MKYLLRNGKVEYSGNKKQIIDYVKQKYKGDLWVNQNINKLDNDFGCFKFTLDMLGLELSDKMPNKEYNKIHKR